MKFSFIVMIFLLPLNLMASSGYNVGNGGDVLVCKSESMQQEIMLLDLFEMKFRYRLSLTDELTADTDRGSALAVLFKRLEGLTPEYGSKIESLYKDFWQLVTFVDPEKMPEVKDEGIRQQLDHCYLSQAAINFTDPTQVMRFKFIISRDVWNRITPVEQALLILHELMYRERALRGVSSINGSEPIRRMVGLVASQSLYDPAHQKFVESIIGGR